MAAFTKFYDGGVPNWFMMQFQGTLLDLFPGSLTFSYFLIAFLELASFLLVLGSLLKREYLPQREKRTLQAGLILCQVTFVALAFGERLTHKYTEAFELFAYAVLVFLAQQVLLRKDPTVT
jgi:hypothetical protein